MKNRIFIIITSLFAFMGSIFAQQIDSPEKYWTQVESKIPEKLCGSEEVYAAVSGFLKYLSYDEQIALWEKYEYETLEYVIFVHLSTSYSVDSIRISLVGQNKCENSDWLTSIENGLSKRLSEWPDCSIPIWFPNESWTVVLPYSFYSTSKPHSERFTGTSTRELKDSISNYAKKNLSVVLPIRVLGWGIVH